MKVFGCWLLVLAMATPLAAQAKEETFAVTGQVINSQTGEPIERALVTAMLFLQPADQSASARRDFRPEQRRVLTGAGGVFRLEGLPRGRLHLSARKPQFSHAAVPQFVELPSAASIVLKLTPQGVITGTVTGKDGAPLRSINLRLLHQTVLEGRKTFTEARTVGTDDRGRFRLWNLDAGRYILYADGRSDPAITTRGGLPRMGWSESSPVTYYSNAKTRDAATPIDLQNGQQADVKLSLASEPAFVVAGKLTGAASGDVKFTLVSDAGDPVSPRVAYNSAGGQFVLSDVVAGSYRLTAEQSAEGGAARHAAADLRVAGGNVSGVLLDLAEDVTPEIVPHCEGQAAEGDGFAQLRISHNICSASMHLVNSSGQSYSLFQFAQEPKMHQAPDRQRLPPGKYWWKAAIGGTYLTRVSMNGADILPESPIEIAAAAPAPRFELWGQFGGARLEVAMPADDTRHLLLKGPGEAYYPEVLPPLMGSFAIGDLAPGEYQVYLLPTKDFEYRNPDLMREQRAAATVTLEAGKTAQVTIK